MGITINRNFKLIMFALVVGYITLVSQSVFAAKGGKPPPAPVIADDVDCVGCVDAVDIYDGAVTTDKLSSELYGVIAGLQERIDSLEAEPKPAFLRDANGEIISRVFEANHVLSGGTASIITDQGYPAEISMEDGVLSETFSFSVAPSGIYRVYYMYEDCMGSTITNASTPSKSDGKKLQPGFVGEEFVQNESGGYPLGRTGAIWYVPFDATPTVFYAESSQPFDSTTGEIYRRCSNYSESVEYYEPILNEPAVTGINPTNDDATYAAPLYVY